MKELTRILTEADRLARRGHPFALATVVKLEGPGYRRPGARMLITREGQTAGAISGGCLEGEVAQHARAVLEAGGPRLVALNVDAEDPVLGFGTGCDGIVHVLIEPVPLEGRANPLALLEMCMQKRQAGVLATAIGATGTLADDFGRRLLRTEDGTVHDGVRAPVLREAVGQDAARSLDEGRSRIRQYAWDGDTAEVLYELVHPTLHLMLFGDGHDVAPVVRLASLLGWQVTVVGGQPAAELAGRFPEADHWVFLMHPEQVLDHVAPDAWSAAVVMSHNYVRDRTLVGMLLNAPMRYVGALGPRQRTARMVEELRAEGHPLDAARLTRLYGPVGLDIGSETPEEIALSIVSEIQAVLNRRGGGILRERADPIHEAVPIS